MELPLETSRITGDSRLLARSVCGEAFFLCVVCCVLTSNFPIRVFSFRTQGCANSFPAPIEGSQLLRIPQAAAQPRYEGALQAERGDNYPLTS